MTAGFAILKSLAWPSKKKGSAVKQNKHGVKQRKKSRKESDEGGDRSCNLEIVAPSTSNVEFKYDWNLEEFIKQVSYYINSKIAARSSVDRMIPMKLTHFIDKFHKK